MCLLQHLNVAACPSAERSWLAAVLVGFVSQGVTSSVRVFDSSGLAQCAELCWQLRGEADKRQVPGAKVALQHNIGLGGAVVVTIYRMGFPDVVR